MSPRRVVKAAAEVALTATGVSRLFRRMRRDRVLILAYHNVIPDEGPDRGDLSLHLRLSDFVEQVESLERTHRVVPLAELAGEGRAAPTDRRPRAVVTFDDAYAGTVRLALPELERRGLPSTVFVPPAFLDGGAFWWDLLAGSGVLDPEVRERALVELAGRTPDVRGWAAERGLPLTEPDEWMRGVGVEELAAAVENSLATLGSHTWSHPNLTALGPDDLATELERPLGWLRERFPDRFAPWISYPYGLASARVEAAAREAGYAGALLVEGGWADPAEARARGRFRIPRLNVPAGVSRRGFELRSAGLLE